MVLQLYPLHLGMSPFMAERLILFSYVNGPNLPIPWGVTGAQQRRWSHILKPHVYSNLFLKFALLLLINQFSLLFFGFRYHSTHKPHQSLLCWITASPKSGGFSCDFSPGPNTCTADEFFWHWPRTRDRFNIIRELKLQGQRNFKLSNWMSLTAVQESQWP